MEALTLFERRHQHAEWAREMAAQYRRDAQTATAEYWRKKWLTDAEKMDSEAEWAETSMEYVQ